MLNMNSDSDKITQLEAQVVRLEARVEALMSDYRRCVRALSQYDELLRTHCELLDKQMEDAFGRIKNIELKFFPHLARDLDRLGRIIGDAEDAPQNPLDRRKS